MRLEFKPVPEFWTVVANHRVEEAAPEGEKPSRTRGDRLNRNVEFAEQVREELADLYPYGDVDANFREASSRFIGTALDDFRVRRFPAVKPTKSETRAWHKTSFDEMLGHLREPAFDDLLENDEHRPARTLLVLSAEYTLVPLLEGAFVAMQWGPGSTRFDFRGAFYAVTRWAVEVDQLFGRLVAPALTIKGEIRPWSTLTRFYESVLGLHRPQDPSIHALAEELSTATLQALDLAFRSGEPKGAVMRRLMSRLESRGVLEELPARAIDSAAQARTVLAELVLRQELEIAKPPSDLVGALKVLSAEL